MQNSKGERTIKLKEGNVLLDLTNNIRWFYSNGRFVPSKRQPQDQTAKVKRIVEEISRRSGGADGIK